jgi:hypothetical protein
MATAEQIQAATQEFIASTPEMGAYLTAENIEKIAAYVQGAFPDAVSSPAAYEIAFKDLLATRKLKRIPNYVPPITNAERALVRDTPCHLHRELYRNDEAYRTAFDRIAEEEKDRQELLAWANRYRAMAESDPNEVARRVVEEPGFMEAVQRLIDEGLI